MIGLDYAPLMTLPRLPLPNTSELDFNLPRLFPDAGFLPWSPNHHLDFNGDQTLMSSEEFDLSSSSTSKPKAQRGRLACLRCRMKKTKCDGNTPCDQCIKSLQDCSYEERRKPELSEKALSQKLAMLQSRYDALSAMSQQSGSGDSTRSNSSGPTFSSQVSVFPSGTSETSSSAPVLSETAKIELLRVGVSFMPRCNYNLDADTLFKALAGDESALHPSFINAVMLIGHFYTSGRNALPPGTPQPEYFVQQIRSHMASALSNVEQIMHYVAASIMLSWWLIHQGRFLEGQYEISGTARLAIDCGLHQIDQNAINIALHCIRNPQDAALYPQTGILGLPRTVDELEFRIGVFWGVFVMDKNSALMTGLPAAFDEHVADVSLRITTVFPKDPGSYGDEWHPEDFTSIDDVMGYPQLVSTETSAFVPGDYAPPRTLIAASAQAMALLLRAIRLSCTNVKTPEEASKLRSDLITLNQSISRFTAKMPQNVTLPSIRTAGAPYAFNAINAVMAYFCITEIRCAAYVIIIKMHQAAAILEKFQNGAYRLSASMGMGEEKRLAAARAVTTIALDVLLEFSKEDCPFTTKDGVCVIIGFLWAASAVVLVEKVASLRQKASNEPRLAVSIAAEIQGYFNDLTKMLEAIKVLAKMFPILSLQVDKIQELVDEAAGQHTPLI